MKYRAGYKYQLAEDLVIATHMSILEAIKTPLIEMEKNGILTIKSGYAWDGASGPTWDTENTKTPSCVHDALYQLMRMGALGIQWRVPADRLLQKMMKERGMQSWRAWYWYKGLQVADGDAAMPENKKEVFEVP